MEKEISKATLKRLPTYLAYLKSLPEGSSVNISATALAAGLHMGEVQVRKDLALTGLLRIVEPGNLLGVEGVAPDHAA